MDATTALEITRLRAEVASANAALLRMQGLLLEYVAKQSAQRMFVIGLAAHTGQKLDSMEVMARGVEQATRDARSGLRGDPGASGQLIVDELARIGEELRGRMS